MAATEPTELIVVDTGTVACDGGSDPSGHPRVFLNLGDDRQVDCPYCGRRYMLAPPDEASAAPSD